MMFEFESEFELVPDSSMNSLPRNLTPSYLLDVYALPVCEANNIAPRLQLSVPKSTFCTTNDVQNTDLTQKMHV